MGCSVCHRALYFSERVAWPQHLCFPCATARGLVRICDGTKLARLRRWVMRFPAWWQWTAYLEIALRWDRRVEAKIGRDYQQRL